MHPVITLRFGKNIQLRKYWLDVDFPKYPPPEFERSGIELSDEGISWVTMPVDSWTVHKTRQLLWPSAISQSFWNFTKVLFVEEAKRVAEALGIRPTQKPQVDSIDQMLSRKQETSRKFVKSGKPGQISGDTGDAPKSFMDMPTPVPADPRKKDPDSEDIGPQEKFGAAVRRRLIAPLLAFQLTLNQTWRPVAGYPARGSILFSGMVELESPTAYLVFDVSAAWDPKKKPTI